MALVVCWYDFICFSIVGGAVIVSLYVLWRREGSRRGEEKSLHENLLDSDGSGEAVITRAGHIRSNQLWTSCWRGLHPGWLLGTRSVSFCVLAGFLSWDVVKYGGSIFLYYTEWTFSLVMLYFAIGCVVSAHGCWLYYSKKPGSGNGERNEASRVDLEESRSTFRGKEYSSIVKLQSHNYHEDVLQRAGFWGHLMQAAYQTCAGAVILTDIVFWIIIVPFLSDVHLCLNLLMGCMHILNATFILLDTAVNSLPFPWFRLSYFVIWSSAYVIYQWVVHACGLSWGALLKFYSGGIILLLFFTQLFDLNNADFKNGWPYPFLVLSSPWAPLWYFLLAVAHLPCYGLYALIVKAKNSLFSKWFPNFFIRTN